MDHRRDALLGAAPMIDAVNRVAFSHQPHPVITVGAIRVRPNSHNTISDEQSLFIDRARYVNLDIVILQVNSNNLTDYISFRRNEINRDHKGDVLGPSPPEIQFIETVRRVAS